MAKNKIILYRMDLEAHFSLFLFFWGESLQSEKVKNLSEHLKEKYFLL